MRRRQKAAYLAQMNVGMLSNTTWKTGSKRRVSCRHDATKDAIFSACKPRGTIGHDAAKPSKDEIFTAGNKGEAKGQEFGKV
jgi:hypothetical protein